MPDFKVAKIDVKAPTDDDPLTGSPRVDFRV